MARNVLGHADANSTEFNKDSKAPVVCLQEEQKHIENMGATMRLGAYPAHIKTGTLCSKLYGGKEIISERHRHRYEFNNSFYAEFEKAGMRATGVNPDTGLVEAVEVVDHPWYVSVQFHPEYKSTVKRPHPLFVSFVAAAIANRKEK